MAAMAPLIARFSRAVAPRRSRRPRPTSTQTSTRTSTPAPAPAACSSTTRAATVTPPARRAVLIDLDNIGPRSPEDAPVVLAALMQAAGAYDVALASGRDISYAAFSAACTLLGVGCFEAPGIRDGADRALLASADALAAVGVTDFAVISADHAFAALPGRVEVIVPTDRPVARRLAQRADSVTRVAIPKRLPEPAPTAQAPARGTGSAATARRRRARARAAASTRTLTPVAASPVTLAARPA